MNKTKQWLLANYPVDKTDGIDRIGVGDTAVSVEALAQLLDNFFEQNQHCCLGKNCLSGL